MRMRGVRQWELALLVRLTEKIQPNQMTESDEGIVQRIESMKLAGKPGM